MKSDGDKKKIHIKYPIPNRTLKSVGEIAPLQEEIVVAIIGGIVKQDWGNPLKV